MSAAARNNAGLCDSVCRTHGLQGDFGADAWSSSRRTPLLYPDAVTLRSDASAEEVLARIDRTGPGASVKDSFACLDLSRFGFTVLFEARWIYRPAELPVSPVPLEYSWEPVEDPDQLAIWSGAWSAANSASGVFQPQLLADESVTVLGGWNSGRLVAGAVMNRSESVVGISNLFYSDVPAADAWAGCVQTVSRLWPGRAIVGYEHDGDLTIAIRYGFSPIGAVRIWVDASDR